MYSSLPPRPSSFAAPAHGVTERETPLTMIGPEAEPTANLLTSPRERAAEDRGLEHRDVLGRRARERADRPRRAAAGHRRGADHEQVAVEAEVLGEALDDLVAAACVDEGVLAAAAGDDVVAETGVDHVVVGRADDLVVAVAADQVDAIQTMAVIPAPLRKSLPAQSVDDQPVLSRARRSMRIE